MAFDFRISLSSGGELEIALEVGQIVFVLGANGTGKSTLMQRLFSQNHQQSRRISAHRQTWFETGAINISAAQRKVTGANILNGEMQPDSRWKDAFANKRASLSIYDLVDAENVRARGIAGAVDKSDNKLVQELREKEAPVKIINQLLKLSNLPIEIMIEAGEDVLASRSGSEPYSISELSDGERNALLIAADILTAKPGTLLIIDEPERHLHRSIISPLLTLLFKKRPDCAFVVSTHDVTLSIDNPESRTVLVRGCQYTAKGAATWEADLMAADTGIDDVLKQDILGARRRMLFVEGGETSLDKSLYSLLFPNVSVIAKQSCRDVQYAVLGIRESANLHWIKAFGLIDNDHRHAEQIEKLKEGGVYALSVVTVESIYYDPDIQERVTERQSSVTGEDVEAKLLDAKLACLGALFPHRQRLSERVAESAIRADLMSKLPRRNDIAAATAINISIDVPEIVAAEVARFEKFYHAANIKALIRRYPVRETPALDKIVSSLGFKDREQYESSVRTLIINDPSTLEYVRGMFGTLAADIEAG